MEFKTVGRDRLARELLKSGPITASDLADCLGISAVAVRKHLDDMETKSLVESHEIAPFGPAKPKGRGRPARVYSLTSQGRDFFENQYQALAQDAVSFMASTYGNKVVKEFAMSRANEMLKKYGTKINQKQSVQEKVEVLSNSLSQDGFAATTEKHPEFCDAELEAFNELLGVNVTRISTIANGGNICTSLVSTLSKNAVSSAQQHKEKK
jgi:predicted ArsR family transcriptional regulator